MRNICKVCNSQDTCSYLKRGNEGDCIDVQTSYYGYEEAVERACEWIKDNAVIGLMTEEVDDFIDDFKKAMEENI